MTIPKAQAPEMVWPREGSSALLWPPSAQVSSAVWPLPSQAAAMAFPSEDGSSPSPGVLRPTRAPVGPAWVAGLADRAGALADLTPVGTLTATATGYTGWSSVNNFTGTLFAAPGSTMTLAVRCTLPPNTSTSRSLLNRIGSAGGLQLYIFANVLYANARNAANALIWGASIAGLNALSGWAGRPVTIFWSYGPTENRLSIIDDETGDVYATDTGTPTTDTAAIDVGHTIGHGGAFGSWSGEIREIATFTTALTLAQCQAIAALVGPSGAPIDWASAATPPAHRRFGRGVNTAALANAADGSPIAPTGDVWPGLGVEDYVSEGDTLGIVRMRNGPGAPAVGSIVGLPASQRRAGYDRLTHTAYGLVAIDNGDITAVIKLSSGVLSDGSSGETSQYAICSKTGNPSLFFWLFRRTILFQIRNASNAEVFRAQTSNAPGLRIENNESDLWVVFQYNKLSGEGRAALYNADGTLRSEDTDTASATVDYGGVYELGRTNLNPALNFTFSGVVANVIHEAHAWDGTALSNAAIEAIIAGRVAGTLTVDQVRTVHGADLATDGAVSGIVDPLDPTLLAYQSAGTAGDITAEPAP